MGEETIGSSLRARRVDLGLDQREAAAQIGMSRTTFSSYEHDTQRPSADVLPALARFLDVSLEELLTLYGASAIAAIRLSLERVLHSQVNEGTEFIKSELATALRSSHPSHLPPESEAVPDVAVAPAPTSAPTSPVPPAPLKPVSSIFATPPRPATPSVITSAPPATDEEEVIPELPRAFAPAQLPDPTPSTGTVRTAHHVSVPGSHPPVELLIKEKKKKNKKKKNKHSK